MDNMEFQHVETDVSTPDNKQTTLKLKQPELEATFKFDDENGQMGASNWNQDLGENVKGVLVDLQQHWLADYQKSREKVLVDTVEKLHQEFVSEQQRIRTELLDRFKKELEDTKANLDEQYNELIKSELQKQSEKHKREISVNKKKQWCYNCELEAIYHCCWNTAYCSVECQQTHWPTHRRTCRRKKAAANQNNAQNAASNSSTTSVSGTNK